MINTEQHTPAASAAPEEPFQARVQPWMMACFGAAIAADGAERNHRFLEESLELVQACGCTASEAHQLVDYVHGRPGGEPAQEVGGVMVTLAALCLAQGLDMNAAGETELARIWTKVEAIRAKQAAKPKHSPLPAAAALQAVADEWTQFADWASAEGLIRESFGIRFTSSMCDVALKAWKAGRAAIASTPVPRPAAKDTCAQMRALCGACSGTGDVHGPDGEWRGQCTCVHAWQQRAEKAEARVMELGAQLARRGAPLSPETRQAIAAARAAGQSIAATPGGLVFMNDGAERDCSALDCPACGGSGHAADASAGSTP